MRAAHELRDEVTDERHVRVEPEVAQRARRELEAPLAHEAEHDRPEVHARRERARRLYEARDLVDAARRRERLSARVAWPLTQRRAESSPSTSPGAISSSTTDSASLRAALSV